MTPRERGEVFENLCLSRRISSLLNDGAQFGCDGDSVECKVGVDYTDGGETDGRKRPRGSMKGTSPKKFVVRNVGSNGAVII